MNNIPESLAGLQALPQWVCFIMQKRGGKLTKPPINPHIDAHRPLRERLAHVDNPATWSTYQQAIARYKASKVYGYQGIGFMFSSTDPFCGIDVDHCCNPRTGEIAAWARSTVERLNSYTELSPSGRGLHIIELANMVAIIEKLGRADIQHRAGTIESYDQDHYFTITGRHLQGTPKSIEARQDELTELYCELFPAKSLSIREQAQHEHEISSLHVHPVGPAPSVASIPDAVLLDLARSASRTGTHFSHLYDGGDISDFINPATGAADHSRADLALMGYLAYWTRQDAARMERLFQQSSLYRPERWKAAARSGETYGQGTIRQACTQQRRVYDPTWKPTRKVPQTTTDRDGNPQYGTIDTQAFPHVLSSCNAHVSRSRALKHSSWREA